MNSTGYFQCLLRIRQINSWSTSLNFFSVFLSNYSGLEANRVNKTSKSKTRRKGTNYFYNQADSCRIFLKARFQKEKWQASRQFVWNQIANELSLDKTGKRSEFFFFSLTLLILRSRWQTETSPRQIRQFSSQITPTVFSNDREHTVMTTGFKYDKVLSYFGWDESVHCSAV